jgi:hypothetical protein
MQLESTWTAAQDGCVVLNSETGVPTLISIVVTDFALLLIMLVGLLRSCRHGDGMIGLTRFLWKQVTYVVVLSARGHFHSLTWLPSVRVSFGY